MMVRWIGWCVLAALVACGGDDKPVGNQDAAVYEPGQLGDGDGAAGDGDGTAGDGDGTAGDGDGTAGDGDGDGDGTAGDGDGDGDGTAGDGDGVNLPSDGSFLSVCTEQTCNDGLSCLGAGAGSAGYCTEECGTDKDCSDIEGLLTVCGGGGQCIVDCTDGANGSNGTCPTNMECSGGVCNYPSNAGADSGQWDSCEGDNACTGDLTCEGRTQSPFPGQSSPGFCTTTCQDDADCANDGGAGGTADCYSSGGGFPGGTRYCVIACNNDKECPGDMLCGGSGRCVSP